MSGTNRVSALSGEACIALVDDARRVIIALVEDLSDEEFEIPYSEIVNPFTWELGHVGFFYDSFLLAYLDGGPTLSRGGNDLYNSFEVDHVDRWSLNLPNRSATLEYMDRVRSRVVQRLSGRDPTATEVYCYLLAVFHENMHAEAFAWMRQTLGYRRPDLGSVEGDRWKGAGPHPGDVEVAGGKFFLGASNRQPFVFDNEKWCQAVEVPTFRIAKAPVTNHEFAQFTDDRGYEREEFWSTQGWIWRSKAQATHPVYWKRDDGVWLQRSFDCWSVVREHEAMVHVGWYEAEAFCNWAGRRLPSEAEWELAASGMPGNEGKHRNPWGGDLESNEWFDISPSSHANLDFESRGCVDVAAYPEGDSAWGCRQMFGNVWEWTSSAFYPYPGYVVDEPYREYSAPWFGYPKVLRGGSWATRSSMLTTTYRNFFEPGRRDVFAGFRTCAR